MATATPSPDHVSAAVLIDSDSLYEVVDGLFVEKPAMGSYELEIANILAGYLTTFAAANRLGKVLVEMIFRIDRGRDLQRRPDVAFVSNERWPWNRRVPQDTAWDMVPDLAVEVISRSNTADKVQEKIHEYFRAGVFRVWVVYPRTREVLVYESTKIIRVFQVGDDLEGDALLPGFRLAVRCLFEDDPE